MSSYRIAPLGEYRVVFPSQEESGLDFEWRDFNCLADAIEVAQPAGLPVYDDKGEVVHQVASGAFAPTER